ncbi:DNA/RNA non-specific endonuclease [Apilactobacillus ozensis]|nr:DNA/RNA non-specific endonuclease [Apilactobacillus ozensis]MCK8606834.1 DNA/RNA non-specific endonuclease [Apilactobacillus ozensis]
MKKISNAIFVTLAMILLVGCSNKQNDKKTSSSNVNLSELNYNSGDKAYVELNGNHANLKTSDWKYNHVDYANLDDLNRTSSANVGYLEKRNLANSALRTRQYVYPTAWHQKMVNREAIINRGHLIAYSISGGINSDGQYQNRHQTGDQNNLKNLFTQTAFSNQKVQTIYEAKVRNALRDNKKVIFYAKPIFRGNELMARGINLQALSTDKSLDFNVYIFNVQPGISFDYETGRSRIDRNMQVPTPEGAPSFNNKNYHLNRSYNHHYTHYHK